MKCTNCQEENPENAHFCGNCGTQLKEPTPPPETQKKDEEATKPLPTPIRELRRGAIFANRYHGVLTTNTLRTNVPTICQTEASAFSTNIIRLTIWIEPLIIFRS